MGQVNSNSDDKSRLKYTIGVISDTHGMERSEVFESLRGVDRIIHAGDIGGQEVLESLRDIAPVTAVKGNMDRGAWAGSLAVSEAVEIGGVWLYVIHDLQKLDLDPIASGFSAVIFGHSHSPYEGLEDGVLLVNPGSAGPKRFHLPVSLAFLDIDKQVVKTRFVKFKI